MPNENRPTGLTPVATINSGTYSGQARLYAIAPTVVLGFAIGDPVITDTANGADPEGVPAVTLGAATGPLRGVIVGIADQKGAMAKVDNPNSTVRPAAAQSKWWYVMVVDDPDVIFEVQEVGTGTPLTAADVGLNTNLVLGANNGFVSGWTMDNAVEAVTATLQVRILGLAQRPDNAFGQYAKYLVKINSHELAAGTAGL